jgi:hypothetical protein
MPRRPVPWTRATLRCSLPVGSAATRLDGDFLFLFFLPREFRLSSHQGPRRDTISFRPEVFCFVLFREVIPFLGSRWAYLSDSDEGY